MSRMARGEQSLWLAAWLLLLAPLFVALVTTSILSADHAAFTGDNATLEIRVLHALRGQQWLGPYSRYGWSHPGPLYFYTLAPFYALSGRSVLSLSLTALLINAVALTWTVRTLVNRTRTELARACVFVMFGLFLLAMRADADLIAAPLASIWNPDIAILPFGALVVGAALLGSGRSMMFPVVVLLHAFVTQTHVGFAVPATIAVAAGLGWALARRRSRPRIPASSTSSGRLWLWSGLLVGALCWALPLLDLFWGRGNLVDLLEFFLVSDRPTTPWIDALANAGVRLSEPMLPLIEYSASDGNGLMPLRYFLSMTLVAGLVTSVWRARKRGTRFELIFSTIVLLELVALVPVLAQITPTDPRYLSEWVLMLSVLGVVAIAMSWLTAPAKGGRSALVAGFTAAILAGVCIAQIHRATQRLPAASARLAGITADIVNFADAVEPHLGSGASLALTADEGGMSTFAGTVCLLYKRGHDPVLEDTPRLRSLFDSGFEFRASSSAWIVFSVSVRSDGDLLVRGQRIKVYRLDEGRRPAR